MTRGAPMRMVSAWLVVAGVVEESVTCTVKLKLPEAVGVPEMIPVAGSSARPPGSEPLLIVAVCVPTPPKMLTCVLDGAPTTPSGSVRERSEEHTSELQSQFHLVCRLLLEKKKKYSPYCRCKVKTKTTLIFPS